MNNEVSNRIRGRFINDRGNWMVRTEAERETHLLLEAVEEIDRLQTLLDDAQKHIDGELKDKNAELDVAIKDFTERTRKYDGYISTVRNAAKGLVTQIDKAP